MIRLLIGKDDLFYYVFAKLINVPVKNLFPISEKSLQVFGSRHSRYFDHGNQDFFKWIQWHLSPQKKSVWAWENGREN